MAGRLTARPVRAIFGVMGIFSNLLRKRGQRPATRPPVAPVELGLASPGDEYPDVSGDLLDTINDEGERRLFEQFGRRTDRLPK